MSAERPTAEDGSVAKKKAVVLVVEDERAIAGFVTEVVVDAGHQALVATNGSGALDLIMEQWPDLVLTDLMMPHLDGSRLARALRQEAVARGMPMPPIILMTAASPIFAEPVRADALLRKPFDLIELDALLRRFLD